MSPLQWLGLVLIFSSAGIWTARDWVKWYKKRRR